jgi:hypothetical protein
VTVRKPNLVVQACTRRAGSVAVRAAGLEERERQLHARMAQAGAERQLLEELRDWYTAAADRHAAELRQAGEEGDRRDRLNAEDARWAEENARWEEAYRAYQSRAAERAARERAENACWVAEQEMLNRGDQPPARATTLPE